MKDCSKCPDRDWCSGEELDSEACPVLNNNYNYQSPIELIMGEIQTHVENDSVKAVQSYGFNIDKAELEKALKYDRDQYDKGYSDARMRYKRKTGEWLTDYESQFFNPGRRCSLCGKVVEFSENYCPNCGAYMKGENND